MPRFEEDTAPMHFPLVDALRGFAALTVLVYHFIAHWEWDGFPASGPLAWFRGGWMAVDLFFVVSGFVIGLSAFSRFAQDGTQFRGAFLRSRVVRLLPLHVVTLLAWVLLVEPAQWRQPGFWPDLAAHLALLHNLSPAWHGSINGPNWSLAAEMQFYLLVALAAPWLARVRPWRLLVLAVAVAWAWRWAAHALLIPGPLDRAYMAQTQLPGMLDEFALGLLLARFVRAPAGQAFLARMAADARLRWGLLALAGLGWSALLALSLRYDYWDVAAMAVGFRTGLAAWTGLVLLVLCGWPMRAAAHWLLRMPLFLGRVSYGIYLWHLPVLFVLGRYGLAPLQALPVAIGATVGLAALSWHLVEQPALRRWSRARPAGRTVAARAGVQPS